jgi:hypothetical protein
VLGGLRRAPAAGGPSSGGPRRPGRRVVLVSLAAALAAIVAGVVAIQALSGGAASGGTTSATSSASPSGARRQAAVGLSGLLAQSVSDRAAVTAAAVDVRACGSSLRQDARTFSHEASSRQQLLAKLAGLPGRSALPAALLQNLTSAWQASAQVDTDLARWTQDNIARGCHRGHGARSDAYLRASDVPEGQATVAKKAFAAEWNPIARQYGLATYQRSQL